MSLRARNLSKAFGDLQALDHVSLEVGEGELVALLGANGSGKSTFAKCVAGVYQPDEGSIELGGVPAVRRFLTPTDAARAGVRVMHQDNPLVNSLSVKENFGLSTGFPGRGSAAPIRWRKLTRHVQQALERYGVEVSPDALPATLSPSQRAMVALAMTLADADQGVELLILDEVTAHIAEGDAAEFLAGAARLRGIGIPILMVTHRFKEVLAFADRTIVLSGGAVVYSGPAADLTLTEMVNLMAAVPPKDQAPKPDRVRQAAPVAELKVEGGSGGIAEIRGVWRREDLGEDRKRPALEIEDLEGALLRKTALKVHPGEIVGLTGTADSGVHELPEILAGARRRQGGTIRVAGHELARDADPVDAMRMGIARTPSDRHKEGGVMSLSVRENITLPEARRFWGRKRDERKVVARLIEALNVSPPNPDALMGTLSGGNQQKVVIAKWLLTRPRVLILDDPTVGVDPGAREQIFRFVGEAAEDGLAVVLLSSEPEQLVRQCTRVVAIAGGRVAKELNREELEAPEALDILAAYGG
ncbi:MAG: sugar ABC transporter ATP-binding protein [Actinobacteria bacterium]|nr:sugar ABC transporter ATP-binding protein [Actinomycetota bacterium]